jgi:hypothetical protein
MSRRPSYKLLFVVNHAHKPLSQAFHQARWYGVLSPPAAGTRLIRTLLLHSAILLCISENREGRLLKLSEGGRASMRANHNRHTIQLHQNTRCFPCIPTAKTQSPLTSLAFNSRNRRMSSVPVRSNGSLILTILAS